MTRYLLALVVAAVAALAWVVADEPAWRIETTARPVERCERVTTQWPDGGVTHGETMCVEW